MQDVKLEPGGMPTGYLSRAPINEGAHYAQLCAASTETMRSFFFFARKNIEPKLCALLCAGSFGKQYFSPPGRESNNPQIIANSIVFYHFFVIYGAVESMFV